ncbi:MAG TPA: hypothetical protein VEV15_06435, partial [Flavisolibacter sp.]|nr:hypothetical protein [Flavisolibacter sp.]
MKINLALIASIILAVGLVAFGFTVFQISSERQQLSSELKARTMRVADDFYGNHLRGLETGDSLYSKITDSLITQYSFAGIAIYYNADSIVSLNKPTQSYLEESQDYISEAISADTSKGNILTVNGKKLYQFIKIIKRADLPDAAVIFYSDAEYIENILNNIWLRNFARWFLQALIISIVTLFIIRWGILTPLNKVVEWVKAARSGNVEQLKGRPPINFLAPLYKEISGIAQDMQEAKAIAREEARLRTTAESVWTPERLNEEMKQLLMDKKLVVVSNREPYMHIRAGKEIQCIMPASGM